MRVRGGMGPQRAATTRATRPDHRVRYGTEWEIMGTQTWPKASVPYLVVPDDVVADQGFLLTECLQK